MDIPARIRIPIRIERGSVFNFRLEVDGSGRESKNRYFVVLNRDPKTDRVLILVTSTTQIAKRLEHVRRVGIAEETVVVISGQTHPAIARECAFDCNDVFEVCMDDLVRKIEEGGSDGYSLLPEVVMNRLTHAVQVSPQVTRAIKKML